MSLTKNVNSERLFATLAKVRWTERLGIQAVKNHGLSSSTAILFCNCIQGLSSTSSKLPAIRLEEHFGHFWRTPQAKIEPIHEVCKDLWADEHEEKNQTLEVLVHKVNRDDGSCEI
ncbi:hypothetical protein KIN20_031419 [Parelaphostrongylus tenuis]|uniref:Uncharacterized protein n=1 Tax=Parelaphostrongylus tenuis TaxID=148309 RepID=A0AAD5R5E9_PARTN|nr:hypothetical protein KIN20_031419 [Parelaphostrongylus tenuis]